MDAATKITREERDRRAKLVRDAFRSNAQEGLKPNPAGVIRTATNRANRYTSRHGDSGRSDPMV